MKQYTHMDNKKGQSQPTEESVARTKQISRSPFFKHLQLILVALVAALVASTGTYLALKQTKTPAQNIVQIAPSPAPDPTANWKTFNAKRYSFLYPLDWSASQGDYLNTVKIDNPTKTVEVKISDSGYPFGVENPNWKFSANYLDIKVDEKTYSVSEVSMFDDGKFVLVLAEFKTDALNVVHIMITSTSSSDYKNSKETVLKILSTFKFTGQNQTTQTSSWKTYADPNNLISFKYPQDFTVAEKDNETTITFPNSYKGSSYTYKNDVNNASISIDTGIMNRLGFSGNFCKIPIAGTLDAKEVKVNNLSYIKSSTGNAAMGGFYGAKTVYATIHNGNCYQIVLAVEGQGPGAGSNDGQGPLPQDYAPSGSKDRFISILDEVVSTFKFTP